MARAGAGKLVGVNEESPVGIAGVDRKHPVVHILLGALALVAGGESWPVRDLPFDSRNRARKL